jgi:hypothetical protein
MSDWKSAIAAMHPCEDARTWLAEFPGTAAQAWLRCPRGDWMLWVAAHAGVERRLVVRAACDCARLALRFVPSGEERPRLAIEAVERWCKGEASQDDVRAAAAASSVYTIAVAAAAIATTTVAAASSSSVYAAAAAAAEAAAAAYASSSDAAAAVAAAYAYDSAAAQNRVLHRCARLVRRRIGWLQVLAAMEEQP